ncbi:MAG TPA: DUF420 domain-containing protein [Thermoplasmata archaeon]|nr:DUF420 domain-containing protein [Thermoplasmata archaeon]
MSGILGTGAPSTSDLVLVFEFAVAGMLLVGMFVVRRGAVRWHRLIQSSMVLVNIPVVLLWMLPQYLGSVLPGLPGEIAQPFYLVPTLMLIAGATAEALGVYILLVAGTTWLPERWRFRRYKLWMRTELVLWWSVLVAGVSTYYLWYVSGVSS